MWGKATPRHQRGLTTKIVVMIPQEILLYLSHLLKCPSVFEALWAMTSESTARRFRNPWFQFNPALERVLLVADCCSSVVTWAGHVIVSVEQFRRLVNEALEQDKRGALARLGSKRTQAYRLRKGIGEPRLLICTQVSRELRDRAGLQIEFTVS